MSSEAVAEMCAAIASEEPGEGGQSIVSMALPFMSVLAEHRSAEFTTAGSELTASEEHRIIERAAEEVRSECPGPRVNEIERFMHDVID